MVAHPGRGRSYASSKSSLLTRSGFSTGTSASMSMGPSRSIAACGSNLLQVGKLRSWLHVRVEAAGFDAGSDLLCVCIYTAVYCQTLTAIISIFKYVNIVCIIQVHNRSCDFTAHMCTGMILSN